jgi:predicted Ser/Thr protein kinase
VRVCATCGQGFSGDARFCPFDGDPLEERADATIEIDRLVGRVIDGRYEVEGVLGQGGMGTVYAVRHRALNKPLALKMMRADLAREGDLAARFIQEARAAALIGHPNVVQITDFGQTPEGATYFVMEFLDGTPLSKLLREGGPPPVALSVRILQQVAAGLSAAHAAGVIHRDLKPDNIHVTASGSVKILDFGVAKMAGAGRLTRTGMVFGTPHYMSPEQASGAAIDCRADVYALGIIMYEMFTGRVPFEADSYMGVLTKHMYMRPEPISSVYEPARELGALEDVTQKCLEKLPSSRYASMQELIDDIESIVRFAGDRLEIMRPSRAASERPRGIADALEMPGRDELELLQVPGVPPKIPTWAVASVALAVVIAAGGAILAWRYTARDEPSTVEATSSDTGAVIATARVPIAAPEAPSHPPAVAAVAPRTALPSSTPAPLPPGNADVAPRAGRKDEPRGDRASVARDPKRARVAPPSVGGGDIVNPWSQ